MTGSSRWKCPRCKQERDAVKKIVIWKLPKILIVHLKRYNNLILIIFVLYLIFLKNSTLCKNKKTDFIKMADGDKN